VSSALAAERSCIFISYRRDDARGASGRVWDWLRIGFGRERVFRDVASIGAGKWRQKIEQALAAVTFRKGVTPGLPFRRPAQTVAALDHRAHPAAD
jgi:hypothetical protein